MRPTPWSLDPRRLTVAVVLVLAGCSAGGEGAGGGEAQWYYHFICNGDAPCLSTNFAGAASGTSSQGPGQGGTSGCNSLMNFGRINWNIPPAQQWCDNSPGLAPPPAPAVTLTLSPAAIDAGQSATLSWSSTLMTSCTAAGAWSGSKATSGSVVVSPAVPRSYGYSLTCTGPSGSVTRTATLVVNVPPPTVSLAVSPATITVGQSATLTWTTWQYTSCSATGPWSGPVALNGSRAVAPPSAGTYTYTLTCLDASAGSRSASATLTVAPASGPPPPSAPTVTLSAATQCPSLIDMGQATTLTWSSTGASSCTASGAWAGPVATSGSATISPGAGSSTATTSFEYVVNCSGSGGTASATASVCVVPPNGTPPQPTLSMAMTPASITLGQSATLAWSSRYASSCIAYDGWTGVQSLSGEVTVTPQSAGILTFQLRCQAYQGGASGIVMLSVQIMSGTVPLAARFCNPQGLAIDGADTLYVADSGNSTIRKITREGVVSTVAGLAGYQAFADGLGAAARFTSPGGVGVDAAGNVFVGDSGNESVRRIAADGTVTTLAGRPGNLGSGFPVDGTGAGASFYRPYAVAPDGSGNVYVADAGLGSIREVSPEGVATTIAGLWGATGSADGSGAAARFLGPSGLVRLGSGDLYVADQGNHTIRRIAPDGAVTTFAGTAGVQGAADGQGAAASFFHPFAIAVDSQGNFFVTDKDNKKIRKITPGGLVSTLAGSGLHGGDDGTGAAASFYYPSGLAIDSADNLYVTDAAAIRKITPGGVVTTYAGQATTCGTNN